MAEPDFPLGACLVVGLIVDSGLGYTRGRILEMKIFRASDLMALLTQGDLVFYERTRRKGASCNADCKVVIHLRACSDFYTPLKRLLYDESIGETGGGWPVFQFLIFNKLCGRNIIKPVSIFDRPYIWLSE